MRRLHAILILLCTMCFIFTVPVFAVEEDDMKTVEEMFNEESNTDTVEENEETNELETADPITSDEETAVMFAESPSLWLQFFKLIFALVFIIALIYFLLRFINKKTKSFTKNQTLKNLGGVPLGPNRSIQIVQVGKRLLVVGVGETIQLLKEIEDEQEIELLMKEQETEMASIEAPITKIFDFFQKGKKEGQENRSKAENLQFSDVLNKQLEDVSKSQRKIHEAMKEHGDE